MYGDVGCPRESADEDKARSHANIEDESVDGIDREEKCREGYRYQLLHRAYMELWGRGHEGRAALVQDQGGFALAYRVRVKDADMEAQG